MNANNNYLVGFLSFQFSHSIFTKFLSGTVVLSVLFFSRHTSTFIHITRTGSSWKIIKSISFSCNFLLLAKVTFFDFFKEDVNFSSKAKRKKCPIKNWLWNGISPWIVWRSPNRRSTLQGLTWTLDRRPVFNTCESIARERRKSSSRGKLVVRMSTRLQ